MNRVLTVAKSEALTLIRTKFFILSILLVPIMIALSVGFNVMAQKRVDEESRTIAVIDRTGLFVAPLAARAAAYERGDGTGQPGPKFTIETVRLDGRPLDEIKLELSQRVKSKKLFGYVEVPEAVIDHNAVEGITIDYYTETPSYDALPRWLRGALNAEIVKQRFARASLDPALTEPLTRPVNVETLGLLGRNADGTIAPAKKVNRVQTFVLPFGLMYILFMAVMMNAPQMMTAIVEEKMSRISEVLLASATPFQILAGKLIGVASVSVALALVYLAGAVYVSMSFGQFDLIQPELVAWFVVFLVCAVVIFGSVFLAIGAASSDLKDAQSLMQPAMFFVMIPIIMSFFVLRSPSSPIAVVASLVPTATPFLMMIRLAVSPPPPLWQVLLSLVLTIGTATAFVWIAAKIFRVGLLMQGKPPNLPELMKWIRA